MGCLKGSILMAAPRRPLMLAVLLLIRSAVFCDSAQRAFRLSNSSAVPHYVQNLVQNVFASTSCGVVSNQAAV